MNLRDLVITATCKLFLCSLALCQRPHTALTYAYLFLRLSTLLRIARERRRCHNAWALHAQVCMVLQSSDVWLRFVLASIQSCYLLHLNLWEKVSVPTILKDKYRGGIVPPANAVALYGAIAVYQAKVHRSLTGLIIFSAIIQTVSSFHFNPLLQVPIHLPFIP